MPEEVWPISIFISSVMSKESKPERNRVIEIRSKLYDTLDSYFFFKPYKLEENDSSVLGLKATYLSKLRSSDLVIFILDSRFSIPEGVEQEITTVRQEKIKHIYFILPGNSGDAETMMNDLVNQGESNFLNTLSTSDDYVADIEKAILGQLVDVFRAYSNNTLVEIDKDNPTLNDHEIPSLMVSSQFNKEMFNQAGASKQFVRQLIFHWEPDSDLVHPQSGIDQEFLALLERLFHNVPLPFSWDTSMLEAIKTANTKSPLPDELVIIIKNRLKAVYLYFSDEPEQAYDCLKSLLHSREIENVPKWILQDVLIDLRNLLNLKDEIKNQWHYKNDYQTKLDESTSPFYYPGIDHSIKAVQDWVLSQRAKQSTASSNEETVFGPGVGSYSDKLTEAEIFACCNGSITQIRQLPRNLNIISEMLLQHQETRIYLLDVVQNQLLMGKSYKQIDRWLTCYSYLHGQFSDDDAMNAIERVSSYPIPIEKLAVQATCLRIFGDYLSDQHFNEIWTQLYEKITHWENDSLLILHPATEILGMFRNLYRIPQQDIISFVTTLSKRAPRYYSELADIIYGAIDHEHATKSQRSEISKTLLAIIKSDKNASLTPKIESAVFSLLLSWPDESSEIKKYLNESKHAYYSDRILPYIWNDENDPQFEVFIEKQIALMESQNSEQTAASRTMFGTNPFANIHGALSQGVKIDNGDATVILQNIVDTVNNPYQSTDSKLSAVDLMILMMNYGDQWSSAVQKIDTSTLTAQSLSFSEISTPTQYIQALKNIIEVTRTGEDNGLILQTLTISQSAKYVYFIAQILVNFLPVALNKDSLSDSVPQIIQFLIINNDAHHRENKILSKISQCLLILSAEKRYSAIAIGQLQRLVSDTNHVVLRVLVGQIHALPTKQQIQLNSLRHQLVKNANYSVRDLALRDFGEV